jgi:hypothetical protein
MKPGRVEEKIGKEKTRCDPADPATRLTWQNPIANLLTFVFLTKTTSF